MTRHMLILGLAVIGLLASVNTVYAPWSTLGTGYAITSNVHGVDILPGTTVTVAAGSLDSNVVQITFRWHEPPDGNGPVRWEITVSVFTNGTTGQWNDGRIALIRYANNTQTPDLIGDWGVQAFFQGQGGRTRAGLSQVIQIRATSFNVIPEVPIGTIAILSGMLGALGVFVAKKRHER